MEYKCKYLKAKRKALQAAQKSKGGKRSHLAPNQFSVTNSAPPPNSPKNPPGNLDLKELSFLAKEIRDIKELAAGKFLSDLRSLRKALSADEEIVRYKRPPVLYPIQTEIIDAILDPAIKFVVVEGEPRVGKSTACWMGIVEGAVGKTRMAWDLIGSKGGSKNKGGARRIMNDLCTTDITAPLTEAIIATRTGEYIQFVTGATLRVHDTTVDDIKGITTDGIWLTEFDQVLLENPEALGAALTRGRSNAHMKLIFDCNRPSGSDPGDVAMFNFFLKTMEPLVEKGACKVFIMERLKDNITHISQENDDDLRLVMNGTVGSDYTKSQLDNEDVHSNDLWNPAAVLDAFEGYAAFCATCHEPPLLTKAAIDPGYNGLALTIVSRYRTGMLRVMHTETISGAQVTETQMLDRVIERCESYGASVAFIENNSGGLWWCDYFNTHGLRCQVADFGGDGAFNDKSIFIRVLKAIFDRREIVYESDELRRKISFFNPEEPRGKDSKHKAHEVDALLRAAFELVGGLKYLTPKRGSLINKSLYNR